VAGNNKLLQSTFIFSTICFVLREVLVSQILSLCHTTDKYLGANATRFDFLFHRLVLRRVHFTYSNFVWGLHGGVDVKWSRGLLVFGAVVTYLCLWLKSIEDLRHYSQWGSTVRTLVTLPMGRFAWTNHIYFQITQPGCSTITPLRRKIQQIGA
jgi:hypothetical protein